MASGTGTNKKDWTCVRYKGDAHLSTGTANTIDLSTAAANNCPTGYTFDHIEYIGAWPKQNWNNFLVTRLFRDDSSIPATTLELASGSGQNVLYHVYFWYYR